MRKRYKKSGVITVFISLLLVAILSVGTLVLEAGRLQSAKTQLTEATISASTSMIASYNADLYDRFGLLAINKDLSTLDRCRQYVEFNSDLSVGYEGANFSKLYDIESVEMDGMYNLTYPGVLKREMLTRAKYGINPQDYAINYYNMDIFFEDFQMRCQFVADRLQSIAAGTAGTGTTADIPAQTRTALSELYATFRTIKTQNDSYNVVLSTATTTLLPSHTGTVESDIPSDDVDSIQNAVTDAKQVMGAEASIFDYTTPSFTETDASINADWIANLTETIKDGHSISNVAATTKTISQQCVATAQAMNAAINVLKSDDEGNLLLNSYITSYFSNRNNLVQECSAPSAVTPIMTGANDLNFIGACVEYVFEGSADEKINQQAADRYITAVRLINNLYAALKNSNNIQYNSCYSVLSHIAWAYYETCADLVLLTTYHTVVPMDKYKMILPYSNPAKVSSSFSRHDFLYAMQSLGLYDGSKFTLTGSDQTTYKDALMLALWFVPNSKKILRVADLVQLEMRYDEAYVRHTTPTFLMSEQNTFCRVRTTASLHAVLPVISSSNVVDDITFESIKYAGY